MQVPSSDWDGHAVAACFVPLTEWLCGQAGGELPDAAHQQAAQQDAPEPLRRPHEPHLPRRGGALPLPTDAGLQCSY